MQEVLSISCKGFCHQSVVEDHDSCHEILSPARVSVISCKGFCHLVQEYLSCNKECFMQEYLSPEQLIQVVHARGSVIKVAEYMTQQWLVIRVVLRLSKLSHARGSVSCKGFCLVQEVLCPFHARGSVSCKSICHRS